MQTKPIAHPFYKVIASLMWVSAVPVVVALYTYLPTHWLEILGLSLSVTHIWTKILVRLRTTFVALAEYRKHNHYDISSTPTVVAQSIIEPELAGVECETATVWAL